MALPKIFAEPVRRAASLATLTAKSLLPIPGGSRGSLAGAWNSIVGEPFIGAWQRNLEVSVDDGTRHFAVYACMSRIAQDVAKLPFIFKQQRPGFWEVVPAPSAQRWITKAPNFFQNPTRFREQWILSKLQSGNVYVLKQRDPQGRVVQLFILDPTRVKPLVSTESGEIFYELMTDTLSQVFTEKLVVPASEIIHDRMMCKNHPLVGMGPLYAAGLAALTGLTGQSHMIDFLKNAANPGGILTAPAQISETSAKNLKEYFNTNFSGRNAGRIAVVGDGLKYERLSLSSSDSQLLEHIKWTAEQICAVFQVPAYLVLGTTPISGNAEAMIQQYYSHCLQSYVQDMEECLDIGLDMPSDQAIELDLSVLLRGDTTARYSALDTGIKGSFLTINEARAREDLRPMDGGDTVYMQQQNYSLTALAERDKKSPLLEDLRSSQAKADQSLFDASQVQSLMSILQQVASGSLPAESAQALIAFAFPELTSAQIQGMLKPIEQADAQKPDAQAQTQPAAIPAQDTPPPVDPQASAKAVVEALTKALQESICDDL